MEDSNPRGWWRLLLDIGVAAAAVFVPLALSYGISELALRIWDVLWTAIATNTSDGEETLQNLVREVAAWPAIIVEFVHAHIYWAGVIALFLYVSTWALHRLSKVARGTCALFVWIAFILVMRWLALSIGFPEHVRWAGDSIGTYTGSLRRQIEEGEPFAIVQGVALAFAILAGVVMARWLWRSVMAAADFVQNELQSLIVGQVHPALRRQSESVAQRAADDRRKKIETFFASGKAPDVRKQVLFAPGDVKASRKHVDERTVEEEGPPELVTAFLERPPASAIALERRIALEEGAEEAVGQYVRLAHEQQPREVRHWWLRLWGYERHEDLIAPLLGRVVDAAVLADRFFDLQRREREWNAMPFYERIWADYRPVWFPLNCLLRPILGNALPMRVVIETSYPDVFLKAMFGSALRRASVHANWFGIGIQIEAPNQPQDLLSRLLRRYFGDSPPVLHQRFPWAGAPVALQCRRLKAHTVGVLSARIKVRFVAPRPLESPPDPRPLNPQPPPPTLTREDEYHLLSSAAVADGCPSVSRPADFPRVSADERRESPVRADRCHWRGAVVFRTNQPRH